MVSFAFNIWVIGLPMAMRKQADFRGTITYASLNAHLKIVNNLFFKQK